ncbi:MAG TPA: hypothetical protein VMT52_01330 [Planctomycetota bacterium]|nr:hypothetical protein [Planctomycetota bacterium]
MKRDVDDYFDHLEAFWAAREIEPTPLRPQADIFEVDKDAHPPRSRGRISARLRFPFHPKAYLQVDESVVVHRKRGKYYHWRESYAYDLVYDGALLENWHRHRGRPGDTSGHSADHTHSGTDRMRILGLGFLHGNDLPSLRSSHQPHPPCRLAIHDGGPGKYSLRMLDLRCLR